MARIYPPRPDDDAPSSEKRVHRALRAQLPDEWIVLYSRRFLLPGSGDRLSQEGEIDFVVLDPKRGWLGLEVKGGRVQRNGEQWVSIDRYDEAHRIKDPSVQATAAVRAVGSYLRARDSFRKRNLNPPFGWAVVLPDVQVEGQPGLSLPPELLVDSDGMQNMRAALDQAFSFHNLAGPELSTEAQNLFVHALCPTFRLVPAMSWLKQEEQALVRLTEEQMEVLNFLDQQHRAAISGPAGTGKTVLAMEKARRMTEAGQRVLLLCYNRPLAQHLAQCAEGFTVNNFHAYARESARSAGISFKVPDDPAAAEHFWKEEAAEKLIESLAVYPDERFDAVVVDEGQDFHEFWWLAVLELLADPKNGTLYVFYDPNQNIFGGGPTEALGLQGATPLTYNCRNTENIARFSSAIVDASVRVRAGAPQGLAVTELTVPDERAMVETVRKQIHRLVVDEGVPAERIVVMSPLAQSSPVRRAKKFGNHTLVDQDTVPGPNEVQFVSLRRFKGLEADAVILCDVKAGASTCTPKDLYVGTSRARHVLVVIRYDS